MGGLQYCFEQKRIGKKDNKMIRLTNDKENQKNNLFFTKGKIIQIAKYQKINYLKIMIKI